MKGCSDYVCSLSPCWRHIELCSSVVVVVGIMYNIITSVSARFRTESICLISKVPDLQCQTFRNQFQGTFHVITTDWL